MTRTGRVRWVAANLITELRLAIGAGGCGSTFDGKRLPAGKIPRKDLPEATGPNFMVLAEVVRGAREVVQSVAMDSLEMLLRLLFVTCCRNQPTSLINYATLGLNQRQFSCLLAKPENREPDEPVASQFQRARFMSHRTIAHSVEEITIRVELSSLTHPRAD